MAGLDSNTKLLMHLDGNDGAKEIVNSGNTGHIVTQIGTASLSTTQKKFGSTSCFFDGNSDYLTIPDSNDFNFGSGNYTMECWVKPLSTQEGTLFAQRTDGSNRMTASIRTDGSVRIAVSSGGINLINIVTGISKITVGSWNHVAFVRNSNIHYIFINGINEGQTTSSATFPNYTTIFTIGANYDGSTLLNGHIDELRVSKGIARWTSNFTPPIEPYLSDVNTQLLLHMESHDVSNSVHIPTFVGTAQIDTAVTDPFGGNSGVLMLDGNSDYVTIPDSDDFDVVGNLTTDWTIDFWVKMNAGGTTQNPFIHQGDPGAGNYWMIANQGLQNVLRFQLYNGGVDTTLTMDSSEITDTNWHHIAIVIKGETTVNDIGVYLDGTRVSQATTTFTHSFAQPIQIGGYASISWYLNGYMDEVRIQKSNYFNVDPSAYTTITVPTEPYSQSLIVSNSRNQVIIIV